MNIPFVPENAAGLGAECVFGKEARKRFAECYPERPHKLVHGLRDHPLLGLDALAELAQALPGTSVEYNRGDLPIGVDAKPQRPPISISDTIRSIEQCNSWAVLKNIEQQQAYADLLRQLLGELEDVVRPRTGAMLKLQGFLFVSSPNAVTPYHFDPEHNILLQLRGSKAMTVFKAGDTRFAPDEVHETYHTGGGRELRWDEANERYGAIFRLGPGEAIYVPVMAPHYVRNGPEPSISLSITWRSSWSFAEADARAFNRLLRRMGFAPQAPKRWPHGNRAKAIGWRIARRIPGLY